MNIIRHVKIKMFVYLKLEKDSGRKMKNMVKLEKGEYRQVGTYLVIAPDGIRIEEGTTGPDEGDVFTADVNGFSLTFQVTKKNEECSLVEVPSDYKGELAIPSYVNSLKVTSVGAHAARHRSGITSLKIPNTVKTIDSNAFSEIGITSLELPEGVLYLGHQSFFGCENLEKIVLPSSLESVNYWVFFYCPSIKEIHCKGKNPPKNNTLNGFVNTKVHDNAVLYVPKGCKDTYKNSAWKKFKNIVEE